MSGFGLNSLTTSMEFSSITGAAVSIQTSIFRISPYALRTNPATSTTAFVRYHPYAADQSAVAYQRFYLRIATLPGAAATICRFSSASNNACAQIRLNTNGTLTLWDAANNPIGSASSTLSTGVWYMIELGLDASTNPGTVTARLNGTQFATGANSAQSPWSRVLVGVITAAITDLYFADWAVNDSSGSAQNSWPGEGAVFTLVPASDGDNSQWRKTDNVTSGDNTSWQLVNQIPPDDATTYTQTLTATAVDSFVIASTGVAAATVNVVQVGFRFSNTPGGDAVTAVKVQLKKFPGGTVAQSAAIIPNSTTLFSNAPAEPRNPPLTLHTDPDGLPWNIGNLTTSQIGYQLTAAGTNRIRVSGIWALADITPSAPTNAPPPPIRRYQPLLVR